MQRKYYTLCERVNGQWAPQFGSYDADDVDQERKDYIEGGTRKRDLRMLVTAPSQAAVMAEVAKLNGN